ncbi:PREDICTED: probable inactive tRNA-specific adenosine deaminase-like protein 3 [Ceratosolen solmsi marchali]|uniref:Probable inactive tRNA-specific adenosine deaminase-like protein 3 n=1 Tax=Ceratosolen solmsi marchali TaxID=326594 RepID=A0AAJ6YVV3_9HYME|nr:PREDICTED: probable inactive tRNA-specific adenosine deaminase-like protein 3 [Ceratosolen solmsi marchali]
MDTVHQHTDKSKDNESQMKFNWKLQPILPDEYTRLPSLEKSFIGILKDKKNISKVIVDLTNSLPTPQHLKRCSGLRIYLAYVNKVNGSQTNLKALLVENGFDISLLEDDYEIADIPSVAPRTKAQMTYALKYWPVNFHPNPYVEALISGSVFNDAQLRSLETYMKIAICIAEKSAVGTKDCNGSAIIVDPVNGNILSMAASSIDKHPMWHASMLAIDLVARLQGGGSWNLFNNAKDGTKIVESKYHNRMFPYYPECLNTKDSFPSESLLFKKPDQKNKNLKKKIDSKYEPYLCTGYWAILLQEPCPLCAMALLHSRVSRIFYGLSNPQTGILGSQAILHSIPGLNHRYQVWSSLLLDTCRKTLEKCRWIDGS